MDAVPVEDSAPLSSRRRKRARASSRWAGPHPDTAARRPGLLLIGRLLGEGGDLVTVAKVLEHELRCSAAEALVLVADLRDRAPAPAA
jgi:hypothetical protein